MDSVHHVNVPMRGGKKMKKRKELDALVAHSAVAGKRGSACSGKRSGGGSSGGGGGGGGGAGGGASSHDGLLMSESTDEQEDYWVLGGGKGGGRGRRGRLMRRRACASLIRACTIVLVFACVVATTTVMWLFIDIREQVTSLRIELDQVAAGSQGVPDALQKCHSVSRELQQNQTALYSRLAALTLQIGNFSTQLTGLHDGLQEVEERLKAAPELVNVPQNIKDLSASVASFGSQIKDLDTTVASLKSQSAQMHDAAGALAHNVTALQTALALALNTTGRLEAAPPDARAESAGVASALAQLAANLTLVNDTVMSKLNWLNDDQHKDHVAIELVQNVGQNVTARVTTLEGECARETAQSALISTVKKLAENVTNAAVQLSDLNSKMNRLELRSSQVIEPSAATASLDSKALNLPEILIPRSSTVSAATSSPLPVSPSTLPPPQVQLKADSTAKAVPASKPPITRP